MSTFQRTLGRIETFGLSLAMVGPTLAMAFTTPLAAQAAGQAAPLTFVIGAVVAIFVGLSFVACGRRVAHAGSVFAYVRQVFGSHAGFLAGWALLLTYAAGMAGATALTGIFGAAALAHAGIEAPSAWLLISTVASLVMLGLAWDGTRIAVRFMLALEGISVLAILALAVVILTQVPLTAAPFVPDTGHGWPGVGYGVVFAIMAFAGFEGAASLGEEARHPQGAIPLAMMATVVLTGLFYVTVSYAQVLGYGADQVQALAQAAAPLDELSARFVSARFAGFIDFAAATSAFACAAGALSAVARLLYALGRAGLSPGLGTLHPQHGTPTRAVLVMSLINIAGLWSWGRLAGGIDYAGSVVTIGTLMLILVYMSVTSAEMVIAFRNGRWTWGGVGALGTLLLLWPLWNSIYPVPDWPASLCPYLVAAWLVIGALLSRRLLLMAPLDTPVPELGD